MRKGRVKSVPEGAGKKAVEASMQEAARMLPELGEQTARLLLRVLRDVETSPLSPKQEDERTVQVLARVCTQEHLYVISRVSRKSIPRLTHRQTEIVALLADGLTNKQIASQIAMAKGTLSTHMKRLFARLDVRTRAALVQKVRPLLMS